MRFKKNVLSALILFGSGLIGVQGQTTGTFTDSRDGNEYKWVQIGEQVWMAENLAYLPSVNPVADGSEDSKGSYFYVIQYKGTNITDAKATANYKSYGVLYNWTAAMDGKESSTTNPSGIQGICPKGWHLPSDAEWTQLTEYLGGTSDMGGKLKETGTVNWNRPNVGASNETGFTALPGGSRLPYGFNANRAAGYWWSSTQANAASAWSRILFFRNSNITKDDADKFEGLSCRCVRD